ncbi:MAG: ClbS/DfsB family four-helix bundle protein [SAR202 cluster bacterium]|nr:ClbS/DfsB family four-helix bundle protein [SAR202 cluster bacterium]
MNREQLLKKVDATWNAFTASYAGLSAPAMTRPGVAGDWSVKDVLGHVTTWEEEMMKAVQRRKKGGYVRHRGGVEGYNATESGRKRSLPLQQVLEDSDRTHRKVLRFLTTLTDEELAAERPFRRKVRGDTYGHYPEHTASILAWRKANGL